MLFRSFDAGIRTEFYDYSFTDKVPNENHGSSSLLLYTYDTPTDEQLCCRSMTDLQGNYVIAGITLSEDGGSYRITPSKENHSFDPVEEILFFDNNNYVHNKISFTDKSSFKVDGYCYYKDTKFPVEGATVNIDGVVAFVDNEIITTNKDGYFCVDVEIGEHYISLTKDGHEFESAGRFPKNKSERYLVDRNFTIAEPFIDNTLYTLVGRIAGGPREFNKDLGVNKTVNNLGDTKLILKA